MIDLRTIMNDSLNLEIDSDIISDSSLEMQYKKAEAFWSLYRLWGARTIGIIVDSSGLYTFTSPTIPTSIKNIIDLKTSAHISSTQWTYSMPILSINPGSYSICYQEMVDPSTLNALPHYLETLFVAMAKRSVGQRLKFAQFPDKPFEIDAEALFQEGDSDVKELKEFIMTNRDEDFNNITS